MIQPNPEAGGQPVEPGSFRTFTQLTTDQTLIKGSPKDRLMAFLRTPEAPAVGTFLARTMQLRVEEVLPGLIEDPRTGDSVTTALSLLSRAVTKAREIPPVAETLDTIRANVEDTQLGERGKALLPSALFFILTGRASTQISPDTMGKLKKGAEVIGRILNHAPKVQKRVNNAAQFLKRFEVT